MTTTSARKEKETWQDWLPDGTAIPEDALLTREDLISTLANIGVRVTPKDLANWQTGGVIPYGVLRWHEATGKTRTLYPAMMIQLIAQLRKLQNEGLQLQDIGTRLRSFVFHWAILNEPMDPDEDCDVRLGIKTPVNDMLKLKALLSDIAEAYSQQIGRPVTHAEVRLDLTDPNVESRVAGLVVALTESSGALFTYAWP